MYIGREYYRRILVAANLQSPLSGCVECYRLRSSLRTYGERAYTPHEKRVLRAGGSFSASLVTEAGAVYDINRRYERMDVKLH